MKTIATLFLLSVLSVPSVAQAVRSAKSEVRSQEKRVHIIETWTNPADIATIKSLLPQDWIATENTDDTKGVLIIQFEMRDADKHRGILVAFYVDRSDPCRPKFDEKFRSKLMTAKEATQAMLKTLEGK